MTIFFIFNIPTIHAEDDAINEQGDSDLAEDQQKEKVRESKETPATSGVKSSSVDGELLHNGVYHDDVIVLKQKIVRLGFGTFALTDYFGPQTEAAVKAIQIYYGLPETGVANVNTLEKMDQLLSTPLQNGHRSSETVQLKQSLARLGYWTSSNPTTLFGAETEAAVKSFQEDYNLVVSGLVDDITWDKLEQLINQPLQNPMYRKDAISLKEDLEKLGFGSFAKTDYYGPQTEQAVSDLQRYYGLSVEGVVNKVTLDKIESIFISPFQNDVRHNDTVKLKENLAIMGYWDSSKPTTLYGSQTERAVRTFQTDYNLAQSGIAEPVTLEMLTELANRPLQNGMYREDAIDLKENLQKLGFGTFLLTDYFGTQTEQALKSFQTYYGVNPTGIADETTLNKINNVLSSSMVSGNHYDQAVTLKKKLRVLGLWDSDSGTTLYGSQTESAVKSFQSIAGLNPSGIVDSLTFDKLAEVSNQPLKNGMYRADVITLKADLETIGFGSFVKTDYYGPQTERIVMQFQAYYGITVSGIYDQETQSTLQDVLATPLQNGNSNANVVTLKEDLQKLAFWNSNNPTELFASQTERAVRDFQKYYNLAENGLGDAPTLAKIKEILSSPYQNGKTHVNTSQFKEQLIALGYSKGISTTQYFGNETEARVKDFQVAMNLPVSGILEPITIRILEDQYRENAIVIFIDPGHGGHDSGGTGFGLKEKDIALDVSLSAAKYLTDNYRGVLVKLSRTTDTFIRLEERADMANKLQADYFVSIHSNAFNGVANGFESFIYNGNVSSLTRILQRDIHTYLINQMGVTDRGIKQDNFNVLRNTNMPAILLEFLFIDHASDNKLLSNSTYRDWLGQITAEAIAEAFRLKRK